VNAGLARLVKALWRSEQSPGARARRAAGVFRARVLFRGAVVGYRVFAGGHIDVVAEGKLVLGDRVQLYGGMIPTRILCRAGSELVLGAEVGLNYGVTLECTRSIHIGARSMFGSMSVVRDSAEGKTAPVVIEEDVWVAHGAVIEPGVRVGAGSVVSAGSVVTQDVPPKSLALGNPAKCIGLSFFESD
jgi:acetyltransferase-like isoleucine patch superfamily enzyme